MEVFKLIDILGTATFAVSGVWAAIEKKLDLFGIFIIAFITAMGGGTLRDILIGDLPVSWMKNPEYGWVILISVIIALFFTNTIKNFQTTLMLFDAMGLGFFTILGLQKGVALGLHPGICIALGTITGCFGGVLRDILLNTIPLIFKKEVYATACIFGGLLYFALLKISFLKVGIDFICIFSIVLLRWMAVRKNWSLPKIS